MTHQPHTSLDLDEIQAAVTAYQQHPDLGFACCTAHPVADAVPALLAELRRLQQQRKYLLDQLAKKDAESGAGDRALREFLGGEEPSGVRPCGHDDYHDPHQWADRPDVWCPGIGYDDEGLSGPCDCGEGAVHYTAAGCPAAQRTAGEGAAR